MGQVRRRPEPAAVRFDDRAAHRQPHAHPATLGGKERIVQPVQVARIDPDAGVVHSHGDVLTVGRVRSDHQFRRPVLDARHGLDTVPHQIQDDLLELDPVTENGRASRGQLHGQRDPAMAQLRAHERQHVADDVIDVRCGSAVRSRTRASSSSCVFWSESSAQRRAALIVAMNSPSSVKIATRGSWTSSIRSESSGDVKKYAKARVARPQATRAGRSPQTQPVIRLATRDSPPADASTTGRCHSAKPTVAVT